MPGSPKRRIKKLRSQGNDELADWLENREKIRADSGALWRWEKENPKPVDDGEKAPVSTVTSTKQAINYFKDNKEDLKKKHIPDNEQKILEDISQSKEVLKDKAPTASETEVRTIYRVLKRLDNEEKRIIFRYNFKAFDEEFFQDLQDRVATAPFHFEMVDLYNTTKRACVVCPRGHAKSTTARKYILHQILYSETRYCVIVGASEDMAAQNLRWIRDQLTENEKIIRVYGYLKNKDKWADTEFQTNTQIKVVAKGAGQKIRGANERGRPDLIYIDDLEEDEQVSSKERREKLRRWLVQALLPAKSRTGRIIITGTILHLDSLLKNISENKVKDHLPWQVLWYQAISKDGENKEQALWPDHKPLSELRKLRETDPETFSQEYQNNPASGAMAVFNREEYRYIKENDIHIDEHLGRVYVNKKPVNLLITTDLALSEKEGADYTVFNATGMDAASNLYDLEYERFRSSDPYEQIDMMFYLLKKWHCDYLSLEQVAFQKTFKRMLEYEMEKRGFFFYVHEISRQAIRKIFRIKSLKAPIKAGKIFWQHHHVELEEELSQVTATSLGTHDDVIDTLADAWEIQIELQDDRGGQKAEINTVQWAIDEGLLITTKEEQELALY